MVLKIGNREVKVERVDSRTTTLQIEHSGSVQIVNMSKSETAAIIAALKVEAPKD